MVAPGLGTKRNELNNSKTESTFWKVIMSLSIFIWDIFAVFQIRPVLPPETDKNVYGRTNDGTCPSYRTGLFSATSEFLNFSNRTIIKGDTITFVKQHQNHVFPLFYTISNCFIFLCNKVWAGCFLRGRTTLEGSPSCGRVIILTSLEHCIFEVFYNYYVHT